MPGSWPAILTFDCYGTLVQWRETLRSVFDPLLPAGADPEAFHQDFRRQAARLAAGDYQRYTAILRQALAATMAAWSLDADVAAAQDRFVESVADIAPHPGTIAALRALEGRYRLAILSNTEDALIAKTIAGLQVPFELVTAEQARAYKPDPRMFRFAHQKLGVRPRDVLHVGAGWETDMVPGSELGLKRIWINRLGQAVPDPALAPTAILPDLSGLPALVDEQSRREAQG